MTADPRGAVTPDPVRIVLEVQAIDQSMIGLATSMDGTTREFSGWLGLLNVLLGLLPEPESQDVNELGHETLSGACGYQSAEAAGIIRRVQSPGGARPPSHR